MTEPLIHTKDTRVSTDKIVDCVIDESENPHTVSVGFAYQVTGARHTKRVLSVDCFGVDPVMLRAIPSLDDQVKDIIRSRMGEETEFEYDKIKMI